MKSVMVSMPTNNCLVESHSGAARTPVRKYQGQSSKYLLQKIFFERFKIEQIKNS